MKKVTKVESIPQITELMSLGLPPRIQWISIKERLPKEDENVLCASDVKEDVFTDLYWFSKGKFYAYGYPHPEHSVTHWMPLPEPPKKPKP